MNGALSPRQARTLTAVIRVWNRDGRATFRTVAADCGRNLSTTQAALGQLRTLGLVTWDDDRNGTLRPLVWPVERRPRAEATPA